MALTPVDLIIKELCRETGEPEYRNYDSFVGHIRRGFAQINIAAIQIVKTAYLKPNSYNALSWPTDCIKPLLVGLCRDCKIINLDIDESILPQRIAGSCATIAEADAMIDSLLVGSDTAGVGLGEMYGLGQGFNSLGYCGHDKTTRQTTLKTTHILEEDEFAFTYLSDGISEGIELVPVEAENALRAFALSEYYRIKNPNLSARENQRYREEVTFLRKTYQSMTPEEWTAVFNHNVISSPK